MFTSGCCRLNTFYFQWQRSQRQKLSVSMFWQKVPTIRERKKKRKPLFVPGKEARSVNFRLLNLPVTLLGHYIQPSPQYFVRSSSRRLTLKLSLFSATQSPRVNSVGKAPESLDRSVRRCPFRWLVCSFGQQNKHCHVDTAYWNWRKPCKDQAAVGWVLKVHPLERSLALVIHPWSALRSQPRNVTVTRNCETQF